MTNPLPTARLFLAVLTTAVLLSAANARAVTLGPDTLTTGATDGNPPFILTGYAIPGAGEITSASIYVASTNPVDLSFVLLSPGTVNGNSTTYTVLDQVTETGSYDVGVQTFTFATPWVVSSDDVLAYWGRGAAYGGGTSGFYADSGYNAPQPGAIGSPYTVDVTNAGDGTVFFHGPRGYEVNFAFTAAEAPEPSTYALMAAGLGALALMRFRGVARR